MYKEKAIQYKKALNCLKTKLENPRNFVLSKFCRNRSLEDRFVLALIGLKIIKKVNGLPAVNWKRGYQWSYKKPIDDTLVIEIMDFIYKNKAKFYANKKIK